MATIVDVKIIRRLREQTGAGILDCKNAFIEAHGNFEQALNLLYQKTLMQAEKKAFRNTEQGIVYSYVHANSKIGVLLELKCETDFVAKQPEFLKLAEILARHIIHMSASISLQYISLEDIPLNLWEDEVKKIKENEFLKGILLNDEEKIHNYVKENFNKVTFLEQKIDSTFICLTSDFNLNLTVGDYIKKHIVLFGENIQLNQICKFDVNINSASIFLSKTKIRKR